MNIFATAKLGLIPEPNQNSKSGVRTPGFGAQFPAGMCGCRGFIWVQEREFGITSSNPVKHCTPSRYKVIEQKDFIGCSVDSLAQILSTSGANYTFYHLG